uniref:Uncharacterized protein n=1 Tax=Oncorhynchus kisutch TaxID=8019 RepID=A0A8C7K7H1_ONCKI
MSSKSDNKLSTCGNRRRTSATKEDVKRMCPQQRARYLAYEEPPKEAKTWMAMSRQRVSAWESSGAGGKRHTTVGHHHCDERDEEEKKRQDLIIGQLKAAEARNRVRQMRLQYRSMRVRISSPSFCSKTAPYSIYAYIYIYIVPFILTIF